MDLTSDYLAALEADHDAEVDRIGALLDAESDAIQARLVGPHALRNAAMWYASQGIPIFPCKYRDKVPATKNGFKNATADVTQVTSWWMRTPRANIGMPTGVRWDVVDVDGWEGLMTMVARGDDFSDCAAHSITPRGGGHHFFYPTQPGSRNRARLGNGIDIRGMGGYVVLPPSVGANGRLYRWLKPPT